MKYELYLISKYWNNHKKQVMLILGAVVLLVSSIVLNLLLARTETLRSCYSVYHDMGAMDDGFCDVSKKEIAQLKKEKMVKKVGVTSIVGSLQKGTVHITTGYYEDKTACELMSYGLSSGRMPEHKGEIAIEESLLHEMNLVAETGDKIELDLKLSDYTVEKRRYTLVGIIKDYSYSEWRKNNDLARTEDGEVYSNPDPFAILSKEEGQKYETLYQNCNITYVRGEYGENHFEELSDSLKKSLTPKSVGMISRKNALSTMLYDEQNDPDMKHMDKSANTKWMFVLSFMTAILSMLSIYSVLSTYMNQRKNSYLIYRMCGMKKKRITRMIAEEYVLFLLIGYMAGCVVGTIIYQLLLVIQYHCFYLEYLPGYIVDPIIRAKTYAPYLSALLMGIVVFLVMIVKQVLLPDNKKIQKKKCRNVYRRVITFYDERIMKVLSIVIVVFCLTFGYAYLRASIENMTMSSSQLFTLEDDGEDIRSTDYDFVIYRNKNGDIVDRANAYVNTGVSEETITKLRKNSQVKKVNAVITDIATELMIERTKETKELREAIKQADLKYQDKVACEESGKSFEKKWYEDFERYYEQFGVQDNVHYSMPVVACHESMVKELEKYLVAGEIDQEGLKDGSKVLLVQNQRSFLTNPFQVGDTLSLLERTLAHPEDAESDKSGKEQQATFAKVKVCGVIEVPESSSLKNMLEAYCPAITGINIAANVLTTRQGYLSWGFPQENYDRIGLRAADKDNLKAFDKSVRQNINARQGVTYISQYTQEKQLKQQIISAVTTYVCMLILMLVIFILGYANVITMQYEASQKRYALLNGMGVSRKRIRRSVLFTNMKTLVTSGVAAVLLYELFHVMLCAAVKIQTRLYESDKIAQEVKQTWFDKIQEIFLLDLNIKGQPVLGVELLLVIGITGIACVIIYINFAKKQKSVYREIEENQF